MTVLLIPTDAADGSWPSLGPQVANWIEANLVFGPGDLRGQPARLDAEKRALLCLMYQVYPRGSRNKQGELIEGRRRFRRVAISVRKGWGKSEFAAWVAAAELHPDAPVRFDYWDENGNPAGKGVTDPYIPLVAYTEEQSDEIAYGALRVILQYSKVAGDFDNGVERIMRQGGDGKAVSLATSPDSRDGARTTFQVCDETHRWTLPRLKQAYTTMKANLPKRYLADPWSLEITTAPAPGQGSVAEDRMNEARQIAEGKAGDEHLLFFHRQASEGTRLHKDDGSIDFDAVRLAVLEASGPVAEWSDIDGIVDQFRDTSADIAYLMRVWLNLLVRASDHAFDAEKWRQLANDGYTPDEGALVALGFDGSRYHDATGLIGCEVATGHLFTLGIWERPLKAESWEVPEDEVTDTLAAAMARYNVWRLYADPPYWETTVATWAGLYGDQKVMYWRTNRTRPMAGAVQAFNSALLAGDLSHDGNRQLAAHVGNACRRTVPVKDERGEPLWTIYKERPDSSHKIDACMAAVLAFEARRDALAAGALEDNRPSIYEERGPLVLAW